MDDFKKKNNREYTCTDLNSRCYVSFSTKETRKLKRLFNKTARTRLKRSLKKEIKDLEGDTLC